MSPDAIPARFPRLSRRHADEDQLLPSHGRRPLRRHVHRREQHEGASHRPDHERAERARTRRWTTIRPPDWKCWTQLGHDGAGASNLAVGNTGPPAIDQLMGRDGQSDTGRAPAHHPQPAEPLHGVGQCPATDRRRGRGAVDGRATRRRRPTHRRGTGSWRGRRPASSPIRPSTPLVVRAARRRLHQRHRDDAAATGRRVPAGHPRVATTSPGPGSSGWPTVCRRLHERAAASPTSGAAGQRRAHHGHASANVVVNGVARNLHLHGDHVRSGGRRSGPHAARHQRTGPRRRSTRPTPTAPTRSRTRPATSGAPPS